MWSADEKQSPLIRAGRILWWSIWRTQECRWILAVVLFEGRLTLASPFNRLLNAYMDHIHIWYPILPKDYTDEFIQATSACFPPSVSSCLALLVLAIGCVVGCESIADARHRGPESVYIDAAMGMLPCVLADSSPSSAQCLLLIALYHLCYARPWQAHDFVAMASYKVQNCLAK
jgi:hypothetical protein